MGCEQSSRCDNPMLPEYQVLLLKCYVFQNIAVKLLFSLSESKMISLILTINESYVEDG